MKEILALLPRVMERAAACPEPTAIRHLRDAAIEFCRRTRIWRESDVFDVTEKCEQLAPFAGSQIYEIAKATYFNEDEDEDEDKGAPLAPVTVAWLDDERPGWRVETGPPRYITQDGPNTVMVVPWQVGRLRLDLILLPSNDTDELPDVLVESYPKEIADGAIAAVLALPAEFGNAALSAKHGAEFAGALDRFGSRVSKGQQKARRPPTTRGSFF